MKFQFSFTLLFFFIVLPLTTAQRSIIRGNLLEAETGEPIPFATIQTDQGTNQTVSDIDGFFSMTLAAGTYQIAFEYLGYADQFLEVNIEPGEVLYFKIEMIAEAYDLSTVEINARRASRKAETNLASVRVGQESISRLPSLTIGGDISQYLSVLPGVVSSGEQGGQLFISGGSSHQNLTLIDGIVAIQPFHSLNGFSVIPTEMLQRADVLGAAFNSTYGGRVSSLMDIRLRNNLPQEWGGHIALDPFAGQVFLEGPVLQSKQEQGQGIGLMISGKQSLIDRTADQLYTYIEEGVPFEFQDVVTKLVVNTSNGNSIALTGIFASDQIDLGDGEQYEWNQNGLGFNFRLLPVASSLVIRGQVSYSSFESVLKTADPRKSQFNHFRGKLQMDYYGSRSQLSYGFQLEGAQTDFEFLNFADITFSQQDNTSDITGFLNYNTRLGDWILEGGARLIYYASLGSFSLEPRIASKYKLSERFRLKGGAGLYSQNFVLARKDQDVVTFFNGFLSSPDGQLIQLDGTTLNQNLQKSTHVLIGAEFDLSDQLTLDAELYQKKFNPIIELNRNKITFEDPDFSIEEGNSLGLNVALQYQDKLMMVYASYSLLKADRTNMEQTYPAPFDRRHQTNILMNFRTGNSWSISLRWSLGSGFPFTRTQGFYDRISFDQGISEDLIISNGELGILFEEELNQGRLPYYHRLDFSINKSWRFQEFANFDIGLSVINLYDRANIFYFDRIQYKRVDQFPFIPSLGAKLTF